MDSGRQNGAPEMQTTEVGVSLQGLTKIYPISGHTTRKAVCNLTLDFHVGHVTALLGHNGAGKSTTM